MDLTLRVDILGIGSGRVGGLARGIPDNEIVLTVLGELDRIYGSVELISGRFGGAGQPLFGLLVGHARSRELASRGVIKSRVGVVVGVENLGLDTECRLQDQAG